MESRLSMHYRCDDLGDLPNEHVDNFDNKIDVNVDSNVANFWGFASPALVRSTPELQQSPEEQAPAEEQQFEGQTPPKEQAQSEEQALPKAQAQSEEQAPPKAQAPGELEPEEKQVETGDWARLKRRAWTRVQISPEKFQYKHPEVAQITTSMKKAFKIDMNRGQSKQASNPCESCESSETSHGLIRDLY